MPDKVPRRTARGELCGVATVSLPKIVDDAGIHRKAAKVVQRHSAMRRGIGPIPLRLTR